LCKRCASATAPSYASPPMRERERASKRERERERDEAMRGPGRRMMAEGLLKEEEAEEEEQEEERSRES